MKCPCSLSNMLLQPTPCVIKDGLVFIGFKLDTGLVEMLGGRNLMLREEL